MSSSKHHTQQDIGMRLMVGFNGITLEEELKHLIRDFHVGGVVIFKRNVVSPEQLQTLLTGAQEYAQDGKAPLGGH
jgi:beta-N-acetylhexosaminidase